MLNSCQSLGLKSFSYEVEINEIESKLATSQFLVHFIITTPSLELIDKFLTLNSILSPVPLFSRSELPDLKLVPVFLACVCKLSYQIWLLPVLDGTTNIKRNLLERVTQSKVAPFIFVTVSSNLVTPSQPHLWQTTYLHASQETSLVIPSDGWLPSDGREEWKQVKG